MSQQQTYTISDLAREFGITPRAIRFYEGEGLLSPERAGSKRIYSKRDRTSLRLILRGKRLGLSLAEIGELKVKMAAGELHPKAVKVQLARELVARFHNPAAADEAERAFEQVFARHEVPDEVEEVRIAADEAEIWLPKLLLDAGLVKSTSDGRRMIQQAAVAIDGEKVTDSTATVPCRGTVLLKVGKRKFCRVLFS